MSREKNLLKMPQRSETFNSKLLSDLATYGLHQMLRLGCYLKFIPYYWDNQRKMLKPCTRLGVSVFNLHKNIMYSLVVFIGMRLLQAWNSGAFPLQQNLLVCAWFGGYLVTSVGLSQFPNYKYEIMQFGNLVLERIQRPSTLTYEPINIRENEKLIRKERKQLSWSMYFGLFLLLTNPVTHTLIVEKAPCVPHFISSCFFECKTVTDNIVSFPKKTPFLVWEFYGVSLFLYIGWFNMSFILLGLAIVASELRSMRRNTQILLDTQKTVVNLRKLQLIMENMNHAFRTYLMWFAPILYALVGLLFYGSIRLLPTDFMANSMFPLCGIRCGFEATTPLAMAGVVSQESEKVLGIWRVKMDAVIKRGRGKKMQEMVQRSFRRILCTAGPLYTFERSIVLSSLDGCIQFSLNLLVTFGK